MTPRAGRVIAGRYYLEESIGRGGMGEVWRAHDRVLNRTVAVKEVMLPAGIDQDEAAAYYRRTDREAQIAARVSHHPGIVTVHDVIQDDGRPWIVMEYVPSQSLEQILHWEGPIAAHGEGVLHRDVKPSNVLVAPGRSGDGRGRDGRFESGGYERAVLTDFGIALFEGDTRLTLGDQVMGTAGFTAPERLRGYDATPASDLWSLGATLYAAVEGRGPFERGNMTATMIAVMDEAAPPAPSAGPLGQLIAALLRRDPPARPSASTAARVLAEILSLMAGEAAPLSFATADPLPGDTELPVLGAPVASTPLSSPTQTSTLPPPRVPAQPRAPASASRGAPPEPPQTVRDLLRQLAADTGRRSWRSPRRVRKGTLITVGSVGAAALAAAVLIGAHYESEPKTAESASASRSISPAASVSPTASASGLSPAPGAPAVVEAIDRISHRLPPGYKSLQMPASVAGATAGFSIDTPQNWVMNAMGQQTYQYTPEGPDDGVTYVEIDLTKDTKRNMVSEAEYLAAPDRVRALYPGYERIHVTQTQPQKKYIQPEIIRGTSGALWEFDYLSNRTTMRMDVLLFTLDNQSYTIYATGPAGPDDNHWNQQTLKIVDAILPTFEPAP